MLKIIQVGHDDASDRYIRNKMRAIEEAGMEAQLVSLPETCTTDDVINEVRHASHEHYCNAVMVQLPLPKHINKAQVLMSIPPWLDIDGLHPRSYYEPLTPCAIMRWLREKGVKLEGKNVTILGRSELVGKPLANMMIDAGATVTVCNSHTELLTRRMHCRHSDIVVSAVGKCDVVDEYHINGLGEQLFIDVGINRDRNGKLCGDISEYTRSVITEVGSEYTPVPGGVGKWTVRELLIRLREMERRSER